MLKDSEIIELATNKIKELEQQLQAYKDKEDKLREYVLNNSFCVMDRQDLRFTTPSFDSVELLQLLNDKKITGQFNLGKLEEIGTLTRLYEQVRIGGIQK